MGWDLWYSEGSLLCDDEQAVVIVVVGVAAAAAVTPTLELRSLSEERIVVEPRRLIELDGLNLLALGSLSRLRFESDARLCPPS